jgi:F-type H+-transporting ATPase subunit b
MNVYALASDLRLGLVSIDWMLAVQIVNTLVLFLVLRKILFKPVTAFMEKRESEVKGQFDAAALKQSEAEQLIKEYSDKMRKAEDEGKEIIRTSVIKAEKRSSEILKETDHKVVEIKEATQKEIEREKVKAVNTLKNEIADMAILAASKVIRKDIDGEQHKVLIDQFIHEVGDSTWHN